MIGPIVDVPTIPSSQAINTAPTESSMAPIVKACLCVWGHVRVASVLSARMSGKGSRSCARAILCLLKRPFVLQSLRLPRAKIRLFGDALCADFGLPDLPRADPIADLRCTSKCWRYTTNCRNRDRSRSRNVCVSRDAIGGHQDGCCGPRRCRRSDRALRQHSYEPTLSDDDRCTATQGWSCSPSLRCVPAQMPGWHEPPT